MKFTGAELLGVPRIVVAGRDFADGLVELRERPSGSTETVPVDWLTERLCEGGTQA